MQLKFILKNTAKGKGEIENDNITFPTLKILLKNDRYSI
jgi:hypothetical protein